MFKFLDSKLENFIRVNKLYFLVSFYSYFSSCDLVARSEILIGQPYYVIIYSYNSRSVISVTE